MLKIKKICSIIAALVIFIIISTINISAQAPYQTYTYSYSGDVQISPNAFIPQERISQFGEAGALNFPTDIIVDANENLVIADAENNRVVILNQSFEFITQLTGAGNNGEDSFNIPSGVFSSDYDGNLYVADTQNGRIVVFNKDYQYIKTFESPSASVFPENFVYLPTAVSVDAAGRMYVISKGTNMGVIFLDSEGEFIGFIGAQRVVADITELIARAFMSEEQIERSASFVPMEYSNLTIDSKGFVYVTASSIDRASLYNAVSSRSSASTYAPIKKINTSGVDVLRRSGFFPPVGNVNFSPYSVSSDTLSKLQNPSKIIEVCLLENETYILVDENQSKMFCYDSYGNLLYAFGGNGTATGLFGNLVSVAYHNGKLYALDKLDGSVTVFNKTEYAKKIDEVMLLQENREFDKASELWNEILESNSNFDLAYLGVGKSYMELGDYKEAMSTFKLIGNKEYYGKAFELYRAEFLNKYGIYVILGVILLVVGITILFNRIKKYNLSRVYSKPQRTLAEEMAYGMYVIYHPFNGFWDLKYQKRGSVRSASLILAIACAAFVINDLWSGYYTSNLNDKSSIIMSLGMLLGPVFLWIASNWSFTSLMDGKGSFKDIYISTCYSLIPLILFLIPITVFSHFAVSGEVAILELFTAIAYFWMVILIFFGSMTVHDYSFGKNIFVTVLSIIGMAFILFLLMVFFNLIGEMGSFVGNIFEEISFRL